jgi:hypothetical protein
MATHFTTWVYGMVQGGPPYRGANPFSRQITFPQQVQMSFPTEGTIFHPTSQGVRFGNNYVYSVIEINPTGLNQQSEKYASSDSVATLATAAG